MRYSPGARKDHVHWVLDAERPKTRERRIAKVVERSLAGKRPGEQ